MNINNLVYGLVFFVAGCLIASGAWLIYQRSVDLKRNEEWYFEIALQLKWNILTLDALKKGNFDSAEKFQIEQINILLPLLDRYGQDSTSEYESKITEIVNEARQQQAQIHSKRVE